MGGGGGGSNVSQSYIAASTDLTGENRKKRGKLEKAVGEKEGQKKRERKGKKEKYKN